MEIRNSKDRENYTSCLRVQKALNTVEEQSHSCSWLLCLRGRTLRSLHGRVGSNMCLALLQENLQREKWVILAKSHN